MPHSQSGVSLLESLRERSAAMHSAEPATPACDLRELDRRLLTAFRWLEEAIGHLEVIRPVIGHCFALAGVLTIVTPRFDRGFVSYRRSAIAGFDLIERIELYYRLANCDPIRLDVQPAAAVAMEDRLRAAQLDFHYRIEHDEKRRTRRGVFTVTPAVMAAIRFVPDYHRGVVVVSLRNVDRLEPVTLEFAPRDLGEPALEDLVRLMVGEANTFLKRAPLAGVGVCATALGERSGAIALSPSRYRATSR